MRGDRLTDWLAFLHRTTNPLQTFQKPDESVCSWEIQESGLKWRMEHHNGMS